MTARGKSLNSQLSGRRARSARALGLRTLQHQGLSRATLAAIEAEIWLRILIVERARAEGQGGPLSDPAWATKDQIYDEALGWFLQRQSRSAAAPSVNGPAAGAASASATSGAAGATHIPGSASRRRGAARLQAAREDVTFWVDSRLLARARRLAAQEGLRLAHLIERALEAYIGQHVPAAVVRFHRRAQAQALRLHQRRSGPATPTPSVPKPR